MCDKIPLLESAICLIEKDMEHLTGLLKKCKESTKKKYKCHLISDQINDKKKTMDALKESLQENTELCTMYKQRV
jgi:hypothetical protein